MHLSTVVFCLSAAILAYEVVLMRMFSIAQWHHFAGMIISIALLGFGLSGTLLALGRDRLLARGPLVFALAAMGFVVYAPFCTWLAQQIPFTPFLIVWQPRQLGYLLAIYLLLVVPFTCGALAIGVALAMARRRGTVGRTYALNLFGSGVGAMLGLALGSLPLPVKMNEYKELAKARAMADAKIVETQHHPLGRVDVLACPTLRVAPGLSMAYPGAMPRQRVVFVDGDGGSAINRTNSKADAMAFLEWLPSAAPYQVARPARALVIGVGGGTDLQQAQRFGATATGVEMHPAIVGLARQAVPGVAIETAEGRAFIRHSSEHYDLIQISLLDSLATTAAGVGAANESYLYTVEALQEFIGHLSADGVLCITRWLKNPPRDNLRLFATAVEALERIDVRAPGRQLLFVRGWATGTLLVKRSPFLADEIARVRRWADERVFDVDYFPGATETDVNRRNVMAEPIYYRSMQAILSDDREQFYRDSLFNLRPATDDQPYFFHFFRWKNAPYLVRSMGRQWLPFVEWGYIVLVATLVQATAASVVLIGFPVWFTVRGSRFAVLLYFACLGLGFMFLEIALMQKFVLFLGHPLYAAATVIATFLFFAGLGATQAGRRVRSARWPAVMIFALTLLYLFALPVVFRVFMTAGLAARFGLTIALLAPLAFCMGLPFPLGLGWVPPALLPWAWGVNGCFSVIGAVLAGVLAMDCGFATVIGASAGLYAVAGFVFGRLEAGVEH